MPAIQRDDPLVVVRSDVRRSVRDRFASYARSLGQTPAALIRLFAEGAVGEPSTPPSGGSAQKITLRLRDDVRRRLRDAATANRTTPTAWATKVLEAQLCGRVQWTAEQTTELRAARVLLAELRDRAMDATAAVQVAKAMVLVDAALNGQGVYFGVTAPAAFPTATARAPGVRPMAEADALRSRSRFDVLTLQD